MKTRKWLLVMAAWACTAWWRMGLAEAQTADVGERDPSGVDIVWRCSPDMFPASWQEPSIDAHADAIAPSVLDKTRAIIRRGLHKYPGTLLARNLTRVYLVGRIHFRGISAAGTNSLENVWVSNAPVSGFTDRFVEGVLHAEISSILLRNHLQGLDETSWTSVNPPDSHYGVGGTTAVRAGTAGQESSDELYAAGYLYQYGQASLEEDFNSYAIHLFCGPPSFWTAVDRFPRVARKMQLAVAFYQSLDATFTEERFRGFAQEP